MIITCPHCQTKYQVTYDAIGSAGRKVQCAQCHRAWDQAPMPEKAPLGTPHDAESDRLFAAINEDALDEALLSEERDVQAEKASIGPDIPSEEEAGLAAASPTTARPLPDAATLRKRQADFTRRHSAMISRLPLARLRRASRAAGLVMLVLMLAGAYMGRVQLVERYPDLAGIYEAIGLPVNVIGLDFSNLESVRTLSGGSEVLMVSAQIIGLNSKPMPVPPILVSLLDAQGEPVYEWSVASRAGDLMAGERATFDTRLSLPPSEAARVRLSFAGSSGVHAERTDPASHEAASEHTSAPAPTQEHH
ncbi:DUF3426 domain-containing protein [Devosia chinhatensis]|uniref:Zinc finger/thioredoxin putative domain-containing protein n=1 Tax=Devosia chinhatensis TaxID=429727 RepID=A0A0F5FFQ8_9HYPH|nr:DUF3426 domain-containing protein [Devosia chinhatensis]KKB07686.1 hypothetical protein VE26_13490 [Devosia chinhatensis]